MLLLDLFVNRLLFQNRVILFLLDTVWSVLLVLRCDVTRSSRHSAVFVLCAFEDNLDAIAFLSHFSTELDGKSNEIISDSRFSKRDFREVAVKGGRKTP